VAVNAAFTVKATVLVVVAVTLLTSRTLNVTLAVVYVAVGVPLTSPVLGLIVIPVGSVPVLTKYVYGAVPPVTLANGSKLVIAEFWYPDTVAVAPATADIAVTVKLTVEVVVASVP
jgi:hypothetical protein